MSGCRISGIDDAKDRPAYAKLNLIAIAERYGFSNPMAVNERTVETLQIADRKLLTLFANLRMTTRDHRGGGVDYHFAFGISTNPRYVFAQLDPLNRLHLLVH